MHGTTHMNLRANARQSIVPAIASTKNSHICHWTVDAGVVCDEVTHARGNVCKVNLSLLANICLSKVITIAKSSAIPACNHRTGKNKEGT